MTPTRRAVLLGALTAVTSTAAAGCTPGPAAPAAPSGPPPPPDPDVALRTAAVARERQLLAAYDAVIAADPAAEPRLRPLRDDHEVHLRALSDSPTPGSPGSAAPSTPADLVTIERTAAAAHAEAALAASPSLAVLLAQLAASEASHPVALA